MNSLPALLKSIDLGRYRALPKRIWSPGHSMARLLVVGRSSPTSARRSHVRPCMCSLCS